MPEHFDFGYWGSPVLVKQSKPGTGQIREVAMCESAWPRVQVHPGKAVKRTAASWDGVSAEIAQFAGSDAFEYGFCAPTHLLIACEKAVRRAGETTIGRSLTSNRRNFGRTLSLIPAGKEFRGSFVPQVPPRTTYIYIDPRTLLADFDMGFVELDLTPRLFFESAALWVTATKLSELIENPGTASRLYAESLARLLLVELLRLEQGHTATSPEKRGGLAAWQVRRVRDFIEVNLAADISLSELAQLTSLSPTHFCRAFKRSVGSSPCQYQLGRRIERAKALLADPSRTVTDIAFDCGYKLPGSFATTFRKATGVTPSAFRRAL
jgi:AraC family transcriptional regulator